MRVFPNAVDNPYRVNTHITVLRLMAPTPTGIDSEIAPETNIDTINVRAVSKGLALTIALG